MPLYLNFLTTSMDYAPRLLVPAASAPWHHDLAGGCLVEEEKQLLLETLASCPLYLVFEVGAVV